MSSLPTSSGTTTTAATPTVAPTTPSSLSASSSTVTTPSNITSTQQQQQPQPPPPPVSPSPSPSKSATSSITINVSSSEVIYRCKKHSSSSNTDTNDAKKKKKKKKRSPKNGGGGSRYRQRNDAMTEAKRKKKKRKKLMNKCIFHGGALCFTILVALLIMLLIKFFLKNFENQNPIQSLSPLSSESSESSESSSSFESLSDSTLPSTLICNTKACKKLAKAILATLNTTVDPCENFYQHVCGRWPLVHRLKPYQVKMDNFALLDFRIKRALHRSLFNTIKQQHKMDKLTNNSSKTTFNNSSSSSSNSVRKTVYSFYEKCINTADYMLHLVGVVQLIEMSKHVLLNGTRWPLVNDAALNHSSGATATSTTTNETADSTLLAALAYSLWNQGSPFLDIHVTRDKINRTNLMMFIKPPDVSYLKTVYTNDTLRKARITFMQTLARYFLTNAVVFDYATSGSGGDNNSTGNNHDSGGGIDDFDVDDIDEEGNNGNEKVYKSDYKQFVNNLIQKKVSIFHNNNHDNLDTLSKNILDLPQLFDIPENFPYRGEKMFEQRFLMKSFWFDQMKQPQQQYTDTGRGGGGTGLSYDDDDIQALKVAKKEKSFEKNEKEKINMRKNPVMATPKLSSSVEEKLNKTMETMAAFDQQLVQILEQCNVSVELQAKELRRITVGQLPPLTSSITWLQLLKEFLINGGKDLATSVNLTPDTMLLVKDFCYFEQLPTLIQRTAEAVIHNYLGWRMILTWSPYVQYPRSLQREFMRYDRALLGTESRKPRWYHCTSQLYSLFEKYVASIFVQNFRQRNQPSSSSSLTIDDHLRTLVERPIDQLLTVIGESLKTTDWLDASTRQMALKKLDSVVKNIGVSPQTKKLLTEMESTSASSSTPSQLSTPTTPPTNNTNTTDTALEEDWNEKFSKMSNINYAHLLSVLKQYNSFRMLANNQNRTQQKDNGTNSADDNKLKEESWTINEAMVNAAYAPQLNSITLPLSLLQAPYFSPTYPPTVYIASLLWIISHEIMHAFDSEGRRYGADGNLHDWWSSEVEAKFQHRADCFVRQYTEHGVDGKQTLSENIADNGAIRHAFRLWKQYYSNDDATVDTNITNMGASQSPQPPPPLHLPTLSIHYTTEQMFFIAFAHTFCQHTRPQASPLLEKIDEHAPVELRVNIALKNFPQFAQTFHCSSNTVMNLSSDKQCQIW